MKWIGQHIYDLISRFRSDVYLEDVATGTIASGGNLGLDSNNKIVKATEASGDIASVSLISDSGTINGLTGAVNFTIEGGTNVTTSATGSTLTINGAGSGDIEGVTAGTNLTGGGTSGTVTLNLADASTSVKGAARFASAHFDVSSGDVNLKDECIDFDQIERDFIQTSSESFSDNDLSIMTSAAIQDKIYGTTTVGTIGTGVWEGTAIATDQQKHILHYIFRGYSEGNGSTYEIPVLAHDNQAPFEHNISTGSAGTDALSVQYQIRTMGQVMPRAGTLKKWTGWITGEGSGSTTISLFKLTPADDSNSTVSPVLLDTFTFTAGGNARSFAIAETSFTVDAVSAGDTVFTGIKAVSAKDVYFTSTLEIEV